MISSWDPEIGRITRPRGLLNFQISGGARVFKPLIPSWDPEIGRINRPRGLLNFEISGEARVVLEEVGVG